MTYATFVASTEAVCFMARVDPIGTVLRMIRLTRLRQSDPLYLNPDHIERLEGHHDTVVHLLNGTEYIVVESPEDIVRQVILYRARAIALAARLAVEEVDVLGIDPVHAVAAVAPLPHVEYDDGTGPVDVASLDRPEEG